MKSWVQSFTRRAERRVVFPRAHRGALSPRQAQALVRSLQRFQIGESGDGTYLLRGARRDPDPDLARAMQLFVREEQEHARLLAGVIRDLGGTLLTRHWSDVCFVLLRRGFGFRGELLVLLIAEILGMLYYGALRDGLPGTGMDALFAKIHDDEVEHLRFHVDWLGSRLQRLPRPVALLVRWGWAVLFRGACLVVVLDHGRALAAVSVSRRGFQRRAHAVFDQVVRRLFGSAPLTAEDHGVLGRLASS